MTPTVTISRELAERLLAASKVCTGQDCPPFHHDLALAGDELRAALDDPASSGDALSTTEGIQWSEDYAGCTCHRCIHEKGIKMGDLPLSSCIMIICPTCGNKRCPHASDHDLACTGSNEPGQTGSIYTKAIDAAIKQEKK